MAHTSYRPIVEPMAEPAHEPNEPAPSKARGWPLVLAAVLALLTASVFLTGWCLLQPPDYFPVEITAFRKDAVEPLLFGAAVLGVMSVLFLCDAIHTAWGVGRRRTSRLVAGATTVAMVFLVVLVVLATYVNVRPVNKYQRIAEQFRAPDGIWPVPGYSADDTPLLIRLPSSGEWPSGPYVARHWSVLDSDVPRVCAELPKRLEEYGSVRAMEAGDRFQQACGFEVKRQSNSAPEITAWIQVPDSNGQFGTMANSTTGSLLRLTISAF